jgi:hypothetical protein
MGFYYGSSEPPPGDDKGSFKEVLLITLAVFKVLALPLAVMVGGGGYIVLLFVLFSISPLAGYAGILAVVLVLAGIWGWEKAHPPQLKE